MSLPSAAQSVLGSTEPRIWTPPLRELTPATSYGYDLIDFARDVVGVPLRPWQDWLSIHVGELLPDGRPRFRKILILVARQNGKTTWAKILMLYWMFLERMPLTMITSTDRGYAKRTWSETIEMAQDNTWLAQRLGPTAVRKTISEESFQTLDGAELVFRANSGRAGRSMTLWRWLCDEVREHHKLDCWNSASKAQNAVPYAQTVCISNMGDHDSVVLDSLHVPALRFIETGEGDARLGLFEWSSPPGSSPVDPVALAMANPDVNRGGVEMDVLIADGARALAAGGEELTGYITEVMCSRVSRLVPAIDSAGWLAGLDPAPIVDRSRLALVLDVAKSGQRATAYAAVTLPDGRVRIEFVSDWRGVDCVRQMVRDLPALVGRVKPRKVGWLPNGPGAAMAADLATRPGWPPRGVEVEPIKADLPAVCMGFAEMAKARQVAHSGDPLLDAQAGAAEWLNRGDVKVFSRKGGDCDALYAAAGAVHLARTMPAPVGKPRLVVAK